MTFKGLREFEAKAIESYRPRMEDVAIYRVLYAAYILCNVVPVAAWLPLAPQAFFNPPLGPAALFTSPPPAHVLFALNLLLALFAAMLLVGWKTSFASAGTGLTLLALDTWAYSLGKINHDMLLVVTPLILGFSGWGRMLSVDSLRHPRPASEPAEPWPFALLALLLGFAMFTAGGIKAVSGWLNPDLQCTHGHLVYNYLQTGRETWAAQMALRIDSNWFWKLADWSAVLLELSFLPAALHRRSFRLVMMFATLFHLGILLLFSIPFAVNIMVYGVFVSYTALPCFRALSIPENPSTAKRVLIVLFLAALTLGLAATFAGHSVVDALGIPLNAIIVWVGAVVGIGCLFQTAMRVRCRIRARSACE